MAQFVYDYSTDKWKASQQAAATTYDNVASLQFEVSDDTSASQADQTDGATTIADADTVNATAKRRLGAISTCRVEITNTADNGDAGTVANTNYAPLEAWENGYPVVHNLDTQAVYVVALKGTGSSAVPIFVKYEVIDSDSIRVFLGKVANNDIYDVIVMG